METQTESSNTSEKQETIPHPGSVDTLDQLSSGRDGLERYRIMEDFGQYILNGVGGDILEIGVGESSHFLTKIAKKYNRRIFHCDISPSKIINPMTVKGYLSDAEEITYFEERDPNPQNFKRVVCYAGSSDSLFKRVPITPLAMVFIDGDHNYLQAKKDFENVWPLVVENGFVLLHDTYPPSEDYVDENKCGDVFKLRQQLKWQDDLDMLTLTRGTCIGVGLTIIRKHEKNRPYYKV